MAIGPCVAVERAQSGQLGAAPGDYVENGELRGMLDLSTFILDFFAFLASFFAAFFAAFFSIFNSFLVLLVIWCNPPMVAAASWTALRTSQGRHLSGAG